MVIKYTCKHVVQSYQALITLFLPISSFSSKAHNAMDHKICSSITKRCSIILYKNVKISGYGHLIKMTYFIFKCLILLGMASLNRLGVFLFAASSGGLPAEEITFAKLLQQEGYTTGLIGKWHLGLNCNSSRDFCHHPLNHGFDHFYGIPVNNIRDCKLGDGSVFIKGIKMHIPSTLQITGISLITLEVMHYIGLFKIPHRMIGYFFLLVVTLMAIIFLFFNNFRQLNCFLMRNYTITQQPWIYENLTQRFTEDAKHFIRRYV
uniref:Sulfatase N-terminal domain-containing protein n=1 Tax=Laticauda laticaudata TaxID=8630 RepID=A0A8C5RI06_LATLA